ncbi:hypothetical protein [Nocardia jiangxiensis]|uniref:hypothetical protein n=1 Tax=Nocardia jiangxiensis TaxID=282685 RepID=UPI000313B871|nr:hypothetical protein [Nocardia jiangxiensis]
MTSQILRHTAVVLAGMASIGFTVAAGTYVVNQMGADQHEAAGTPQPEAGAADPIPPLSQPSTEPDVQRTSTAAVRFIAETRELPVAIQVHRPIAAVPAPALPSIPATAAVRADADPSARLPLLGDLYIGANLTSPQPDSLSITLDTNLFAPLTDAAAPGSTRLRTDLDVRHGQITLAVSDPSLGSRSVQMSPRHADRATPDPDADIANPAQSTLPDHELAAT